MGESAKYGIYPNANEMKFSVMGRSVPERESSRIGPDPFPYFAV
jgi:hypothetical protein